MNHAAARHRGLDRRTAQARVLRPAPRPESARTWQERAANEVLRDFGDGS